jgi:hypothetical protein
MTAPPKTRRRINVSEFATKLCCHCDTIKRRIKKPPAGFPQAALLLGRYSFWEDEADGYVAQLIEQGRVRRDSGEGGTDA